VLPLEGELVPEELLEELELLLEEEDELELLLDAELEAGPVYSSAPIS